VNAGGERPDGVADDAQHEIGSVGAPIQRVSLDERGVEHARRTRRDRPDGARAVLGRGAHPASDHLGFDRQPLEGGEEVGPPGRRRLLRPPDVATARSSTVELVAIGDPVPADSRTT